MARGYYGRSREHSLNRRGVRTAKRIDRKMIMKAGGTFDFKYEEISDAPHRNLIKHTSDWDGTLRSYKAEYILHRFNPTNAQDIVDILETEVNPQWNNIYDKKFPMFERIPKLVDYVQKRAKGKDVEKYHNSWITGIDTTDIVADLWKLSPTLQHIYPSKPREHPESWVFGTYIGSGWHDLRKDVEKEMRRRKLSPRTYRHELLEL